MEIYADIVFAINFVMDAFILWAAGSLARRSTNIARVAAGGLFMSAAYCLLVFFTRFHMYINVFASILIMMPGVLIAFRPGGAKEFLRLIAYAYIASFAIGGIGLALFYFTNIGNVVGNMAGFETESFPIGILLSSTCGFYICVKLFGRWYSSVVVKRQICFPVKIFFGAQDAQLTALLDTGNTLHDPITNAPVIIAEFGAVKDFLPESVKAVFYENKEDDLSVLLDKIRDTAFLGRIRMIPFASLGKSHGLLLGFRPDRVEISNSNGVLTPDDVVVGIYNEKLARDGAYQGLLSPELLS